MSDHDIAIGQYADEQMAAPVDVVAQLYVHLAISDPEIIQAASEYPEGRSRTDFIQTALKIGVLSLRAARSVVDRDAIRKEGDALMTQLNERLNGWPGADWRHHAVQVGCSGDGTGCVTIKKSKMFSKDCGQACFMGTY